MEEDKSKDNKGLYQGRVWWKPAFEIFSEISTWIAIPVILAVVVGKMLDTHYGTKPWIFIGCVAFSFLISSFGMVRSIKKYTNQIKKEEKK